MDFKLTTVVDKTDFYDASTEDDNDEGDFKCNWHMMFPEITTNNTKDVAVVREEIETLLSCCAQPNQIMSKANYKLKCVVKHYGEDNQGHYVAQIFHDWKQDWLCFDDSKVSQVSLPMNNEKTSYLLFYVHNTCWITKNIAEEVTRTWEMKKKTMVQEQTTCGSGDCCGVGCGSGGHGHGVGQDAVSVGTSGASSGANGGGKM
eukprot:TRINITY_DN13962_c1_g1_i1.p1 TRINITY_DN13962_c1_g1~~TRINITY_DN13962_c1_g1_i1.p1  ORF type:complete len:213 (-),score=63.97 TRINITY_DN13962_c1_g1_i1:73-681(-)